MMGQIFSYLKKNIFVIALVFILGAYTGYKILESIGMAALLANKVKGNINVNVVDLPGFGPTKQDTIEDLAILTGAKVINEELGDDLDGISLDVLGEVEKTVTDEKNTVITTLETTEDITERIKVDGQGVFK